MAARMYIWPRYVLEVDGKRFRFPDKPGAALARLFRNCGTYVPVAEMIDAAWYDDPDGGPLCIRNCLAVNMCKVNRILASAPAYVEGSKGSYSRGYRLVIPQAKAAP